MRTISCSGGGVNGGASNSDFWGYVRSLGNPHNVLARVSTANPTDGATLEDSAAGVSPAA